MQLPTLTDVHIRTVSDAHKLFYAVQLGMLPKIERRLDAHERSALRPGNVYVWEEKGPGAVATGSSDGGYAVTMERFTEGKSWTASRVRDEFLMYYESTKKKKGDRDDTPQRARSLENQVVREGERDLYIKLTYSVFRTDEADVNATNGASTSTAPQSKDKDKKKPRKWHLNAYFTKFTEGQLRTIDDIPSLRDLIVPDGLYKTARTTGKPPGTKRPHTSLLVSPDYSRGPDGVANGSVTVSGGSSGKGGGVQRTYAPFPSSQPRIHRSSITMPPTPLPFPSLASGDKSEDRKPTIHPSPSMNWHPPLLPPPSVLTSLPAGSHIQRNSVSVPPASPDNKTASVFLPYPQNQHLPSQSPSQPVPPLTTALPPSALPTTTSLLSRRSADPANTNHGDNVNMSPRSTMSVSPHPPSSHATYPQPYATTYTSHPSYASSSDASIHLPQLSSNVSHAPNHHHHHHHAHTPTLSDASSPFSTSAPMDCFEDDFPPPRVGGYGTSATVIAPISGGSSSSSPAPSAPSPLSDDSERLLRSLEDPNEDLSTYVQAPLPAGAIAMTSSLSSFSMMSTTPPVGSHGGTSSGSSGWSGDEGTASNPTFSRSHRHHHPYAPPPLTSGSNTAVAGEATGNVTTGARRRSGSGGSTGGGCRVALAPLHSLPRNHPYRPRFDVDDQALRLLGPG